jgi:hypothetical protein
MAKNTEDWFVVDKTGLAKLLEKKGKAFALFELIQNSWDTNARRVQVRLESVPNRPLARLYVEDDHPEGFEDLTHAYKLFAESHKKGDPNKRGRFNLGEKLVLALCETAEIISTKGSVYFTPEGRKTGSKKLEAGSAFLGTIRMTRDELAEVERAVLTLLPPDGVETTFNGRPLPSRPPIRETSATLPTDVADAEGFLRKTQRTTVVSFHEVAEGENPTLYELGIPVVELSGGERWHVNIHQKVPLNVDRDNVTPAYLQTIRVLLANTMQDKLTPADVTQVWVNAATEDERILPAAVEKVLDERFGKKRAIFDPTDLEANKTLMNDGYTIISGGTLSKGQWDNVRSNGLASPSGQLKPSGVQYDPNGRPERVLNPEKYTPGQRGKVEYARDLAKKLLGREIDVRIVSEVTQPHAAWFGSLGLTFNIGRLGKAWFEEPIGEKHHELLLHEFAHGKVSDHFTRDFADEVGRLGAKLVSLALSDPTFFRFHGVKMAG